MSRGIGYREHDITEGEGVESCEVYIIIYVGIGYRV